MSDEFQEISHTGGKIKLYLGTKDGLRTYQVEYTHQRPTKVVLIAVYAIPQGVVVAPLNLGGIGAPREPPPIPDCLEVYLASDSEGRFGHNCPYCRACWRSGPWPNVCPYCAAQAACHKFLSDAQRRFVVEYCRRLSSALDSGTDGEVDIDMDAVADAVGLAGEKPPFYVSEKSQQHKFECAACGAFNDILGRFGYCSLCGTRNDLQVFRDQTLPAIRARINAGDPPEDCVRDGVAAFDSFLAHYGAELAGHVPLTRKRKDRLLNQTYHNATEVRDTLGAWFDIDIGKSVGTNWEFVGRMFLRRHVYEHNGGEVDQKYLDDSGDTSVELKQHIRETRETAHRLLGTLLKMATNMHDGFHQLLPPLPGPIQSYQRRQGAAAGSTEAPGGAQPARPEPAPEEDRSGASR